MKRWKFKMDWGKVVDIIASDFRRACLVFDQWGYDPRSILEIEER